jgi:putative heme transporter
MSEQPTAMPAESTSELVVSAMPWWRRRPERAADAVPFGVRIAAEWSWRLLVIGLAVAGTIWIIAQVKLIFVSLFVALLLGALLAPVMTWQRRVGVPRLLAITSTLLAFLTLLGVCVMLLTNTVVRGYDEMSDEVRQGITEFQDWLATGPLGLDQADIDRYTDDLVSLLDVNRDALVSGAFSTATTALQIGTGFVLVLFATIFFLYDGDRIWHWAVRWFPREHRTSVDAAGRDAWITLTGYIRGTTIVALFDGFFIGLALVLLDIPYAIPLGVLVFLGGFVPIVGATVSGAVAVLVALATDGPVKALIVLAAVIAVQQIEGNVLQPFLLGRMVRLHPLVVVVAVLAGGLMAGFIGAVVAVPLVAVGNTIVVSLRGHPTVADQSQDDRSPTEDEAAVGSEDPDAR